MDLAAAYARLLTLKDDDLKLFENHLYNVLGISYSHFMYDFDHYTSGTTSHCTRSGKVRTAPTSQLDVLDITRFLPNKENLNRIEKDEEDDDQDTVMNTDSGDDDSKDFYHPPVYPFRHHPDTYSSTLELPERYSHELMSEDDDEPAQSETTRDAACAYITEDANINKAPQVEVMEDTPVYVNEITNNISTMVINNVVNTAYIANDPYFNCYESDARKHNFKAPTTPKPCGGKLTPVETDLRRRLQSFRHCGSGQDNAIAEHFMKHAIFHGNLVDYPYLKLSPDVGTLFDVAKRLEAASKLVRKKRRVDDRNILKQVKSGLKRLKSVQKDEKTTSKEGVTEDLGQNQAMAKEDSSQPSEICQALVLACANPR